LYNHIDYKENYSRIKINCRWKYYSQMDIPKYTRSFKKQTCLYQQNLPVNKDQGLLEYLYHWITHRQQFKKILCLHLQWSKGPRKIIDTGRIKRYIGTVLGAVWEGVSQSESSGRGLGVHL
jgi:hypothetical protein